MRQEHGHTSRRGRILYQRCTMVSLAAACGLLVACDSPETGARPASVPSATTAARAASTPAASTPAPSASASTPVPSASLSSDAGCSTPWVLLELLPPASRSAIATARDVLRSDAGPSSCARGVPKARGDVCLVYVHFYGVKHFAPESQHKNRDALVVRCHSQADCAAVAQRYREAAPASRPLVKCDAIIPTSGSLEPLSVD